MLDDFEAWGLSNLIYSYGLVGYNPKLSDESTLFDSLALAAINKLHGFKPQELSNVMLAFVYADAKHRTLFEKMGNTIPGMVLTKFKPQELSNIVWSLAKLDELDPEVYRVMGDHIARNDLDEFKPQGLSNIAWAFATAEMPHPSLFC